ncbi:MAG: hypothetical protein QG635_938, partial [Bacteroidota bacterium]|nr:hypothetical protein [Bacteroidota bacterium]
MENELPDIHIIEDAFNALKEPISLLGREGNIIFCNLAMESFLGLEQNDIIGKGCFNLIHGCSEPIEICPHKKMLKSSKRESTIIERDEKWLEITVDPIFDGKRSIVASVHSIRDITDAKSLEQQKKLSDSRYKILADNITDVIWELDLQFNIKYTSPSIFQFLGYTQSEVKGLKLIEYLTSDSIIFIQNSLLEEFEIEKGLEHDDKIARFRIFDAEFKCKDGTHKFAEVKASFLRDENNNPIGIVGVNRDITERKITQLALIDREKRYKLLFDQSPISIWEEDFTGIKFLLDELKAVGISDLKKYLNENPEFIRKCAESVIIIDVNNATLKLFEATNKEELFRGLPSIFSEESYDCFKNELLAIFEGKKSFESESVNYTLKKKRLDILLKLNIISDEPNVMNKVLISIIDITMRKQAEDRANKLISELKMSNETIVNQLDKMTRMNSKLYKSEKMLTDLNKDKDMFFSIIAHDLKSPLAGFIGLTKHLVTEFYEMSLSDMQEISQALYSSATKLNGLLENLLAWSSLQTGKIEFSPAVNNIYDTIISSTNAFIKNAESKSIIIRTTLLPGTKMFYDKNMLSTVLRNLISNAIKFTSTGGYITIESEFFENEAEISVIDTGIGIAKSDIEKIFRIGESFTTLGTSGESGTGLGLTLCNEFLQKHNTRLMVSSAKGEGSKFSFRL